MRPSFISLFSPSWKESAAAAARGEQTGTSALLYDDELGGSSEAEALDDAPLLSLMDDDLPVTSIHNPLFQGEADDRALRLRSASTATNASNGVKRPLKGGTPTALIEELVLHRTTSCASGFAVLLLTHSFFLFVFSVRRLFGTVPADLPHVHHLRGNSRDA